MLMRKGGVAGGVKNAESSGKTRFKVVKGGPFRAHFGQNRSSFGAFERILIESERKSGPNDRIEPRTRSITRQGTHLARIISSGYGPSACCPVVRFRQGRDS